MGIARFNWQLKEPIMKKPFIFAVLVAGAGVVHAQDATSSNAPDTNAPSATPFQGEQAPIQLSLAPDIALYPRTTVVRGLSLNIWGENPQSGVALGFVNGSTGQSSGFSWGLVNYAETYTGVQWGLVNSSTQNFTGWQSGCVNVTQGTFTGFESGVVNVSEDTTGFQLGVVNYAERLNGVQLGLANFAMNNAWFTDLPDNLATGFPIVNWSF